MQTKHFMGGNTDDQPLNQNSNDETDLSLLEHAEVEELAQKLIVEILRLRLFVYSLPREEQVVLRALHGLDCKRFTLKQVARRMEMSVAEVRELEAQAIARLRAFYSLEEAA